MLGEFPDFGIDYGFTLNLDTTNKKLKGTIVADFDESDPTCGDSITFTLDETIPSL